MSLKLTHGSALSNLPLFLALDRDLFADVGLRVAVSPLTAFSATVSRLREGSADLGTTGFTQALADADSADPLVIVAGSGLRGMALLGQRGMTAAGLAGRTIGAFADDPMQALLEDVLSRHALTGGVFIRFMPSLVEAARQFRQGEIAALTIVEPWISRLAREGAVVLSDGADVWGPSYPDTVLVAPRSLIDRRPEVVTGVIRAMLRAQRIIENQPRAALATVAHRFPGFSLDELEAGLARQPSQVDLRGLEATILARWPTIRNLQGKTSSTPPAGLIDLRRLEAALEAEAPIPSGAPSRERTMNHV